MNIWGQIPQDRFHLPHPPPIRSVREGESELWCQNANLNNSDNKIFNFNKTLFKFQNVASLQQRKDIKF